MQQLGSSSLIKLETETETENLESKTKIFFSSLSLCRFINARRRIVQPMIDQSNRAGKYHSHTTYIVPSCSPPIPHSHLLLLAPKKIFITMKWRRAFSTFTNAISNYVHFFLSFFLLSLYLCRPLSTVYTPHPGPSGYGHDAMGYMMDSQAHMMHRPPGDPGFHQGYPHYPPAEYYGQHL